jgi:putative thioredoxin
MPEYAVTRWLDEHLPTEARAAIGSVHKLIEDGDVDRAIQILESLVADPSSGSEAAVLLARLLLFTDPDRAAKLVSGVEPADADSQLTVKAIGDLADVLSQNGMEGSLPESEARGQFEDAVRAIRDERFGDAIDSLIVVLQKDRYYRDDSARRLGVALFTLLGPTHPIVRKKRRMFDMYLY